MYRIRQLYLLGQSLWYDYIDRPLLQSGRLTALVAAGVVHGVTSNPAIFRRAMSRGAAYAEDRARLQAQGLTAEAVYEHLAVADIQAACDVLYPLYERTHGQDGFVSLEVSPHLAYDPAATLEAARRLWQWVQRPNLMIKIPGTEAGLPAIQQALAEGISVNVTLLFSVQRYRQVMEAYLSALEQRRAQGLALDTVASVASFFVSRVDTKVDRALERLIAQGGPQAERARGLLGTIAVANARQAYQAFKEVFAGERFAALAAHGARVQRPLWASTSTKNPAYPDTLYVDQLIGPQTVNTVPPQTWEAFADHGTPRLTLEADVEGDAARLAELAALGIDLAAITAQLEAEGVQAFVQAYDALVAALQPPGD